MNSTTFTINTQDNNIVVIVNEWHGTRHGFKHTSRVYRNGRNVGEDTVYYYNRTWEAYEYQTSAKCAVLHWIKNRRTDLLDVFKQARTYKRMTKARWNEFAEWARFDNELVAADNTYVALNKRPSTFEFAG